MKNPAPCYDGCNGWRSEKFRGGVTFETCAECGLPASREEATVAALAAVRSLFFAHFGDDTNHALETIESALELRIERMYGAPADDAKKALRCIRGMFTFVQQIAAEA